MSSRATKPSAARLAAAGLALLTLANSGAAAPGPDLSTRLRHRIESGLATDSLSVMGERLEARAAIRSVYPARGYRPIWVDTHGIDARGKRLLDWLPEAVERQGLSVADYHLDALAHLETAHDPAGLVDLELALSDAFLTVGSHFASGRLDPTTLDPQWSADRGRRDMAPVLAAAATRAHPQRALQQLLPHNPAYARLVTALARLRRIRNAGGWPEVAPGPALREGDTGARVAALRRRLAASGDFAHPGGFGHPGTAPFDGALGRALQRFQRRHGLEADGVAGAATLAALNVPVQARIDQIVVNLERWRWLPETLGRRYVLVNIAGFELDAVDAGRTALSMRVVVGQPYRRTPVFSSAMTYLVLNPEWDVPHSIAVEDKLPLIKRDPNYLAQHGFALLQGWGAEERVIDPGSVDWSRVTPRNFAYHLRQAPGPNNALGRIKFMFPNRFSVYLHDTPARELFAKESRSFSSGCIRVEHPLELAAWLLAGDPSGSREALDRAIRTGEQQIRRLPRPIPIHVLYWTAWVDARGELNFREDLYGRDEPVLDRLRRHAPQ